MRIKKTKRRKGRRYLRGEYLTKNGTTYCHRSGWERSYMEWLDANDDVVSWSYETITIEYVSNKKTGKRRKYMPDFLVEYADRTELIEIKPTNRLKQAKVLKKIAAARGWCEAKGFLFKVVTEKELKLLSLI